MGGKLPQDRANGKKLLAASLAQARQEGSVFYGHVVDLLENYAQNDDALMAHIVDIHADSEHSKKLGIYLGLLESVETPEVPAFVTTFSGSDTEAMDLARVVVSELVHREKWESTLKNNPRTEKLFVQVVRRMGMT